MCILVMCVAAAMPVSHAAGLIRSSQLFPPSLSSRSLERILCRRTTLSLRRLQLQKLPSCARSSPLPCLNAIHTRRYSSNARLASTSSANSPVWYFWFLAVPSHVRLFPYQITQVWIRACRQSPKWLTLLIDAAVCRRFANAASAIISSISRRAQNLISGREWRRARFGAARRCRRRR